MSDFVKNDLLYVEGSLQEYVRSSDIKFDAENFLADFID